MECGKQNIDESDDGLKMKNKLLECVSVTVP